MCAAEQGINEPTDFLRGRYYSRAHSGGMDGEKMNITDIKIRKLVTEGRLKAIVSITLNNELAVHDIKVIEGPTRLFVAMPSRRDDKGVFRDIVHPISADGRLQIEQNILDFYENYRREHEASLEADYGSQDSSEGLYNPFGHESSEL